MQEHTRKKAHIRSFVRHYFLKWAQGQKLKTHFGNRRGLIEAIHRLNMLLTCLHRWQHACERCLISYCFMTHGPINVTPGLSGLQRCPRRSLLPVYL